MTSLKLSIITVNLNNAEGLRKMIECIVNQIKDNNLKIFFKKIFNNKQNIIRLTASVESK